MTGSNNAFIGAYAGQANTTGFSNTFLGYFTGFFNTSGNSNVFLGNYSGRSNDSGYGNVFVGVNAGYSNTTGNSNLFVGNYAGYKHTTAILNTFVGNSSGYETTTGTQNTFLGGNAGRANTIGSNNTFLGVYAGRINTTGIQNTYVGNQAGYSSTTGSSNTIIGYQAGYNLTNGSNNIIIGPNSGTAVSDGNDNVLMGYNSQADDGLQNAIAIGANSRVAASNALILGNQVNVGIGTSAPTDRLEIVSPSPNKSGVRLTNLTTTSPTSRYTDQFLTVNETGEVIKARYQLRINNPSEWSDKVFAPTYQLLSLSSVAAYIDQHQHLPGIPSAKQVAKEGIDLVKMNAALLEKVEELTLYSIQQDKTIWVQQKKLQALEQKQAELEQLLHQALKQK